MHTSLSPNDRAFLALLRAGSVIAILFGHLGGFHVMKPYTGLLRIAVAVFFFISGAVSWFSFIRSGNGKHFLIKRITGLLIPYYLFCLILLATFCIESGRLPLVTWKGLIRWLLISPTNEMMFFPVGQIWFLQVLIILMVIIPGSCFFQRHHRRLLFVGLFISLLIPGIQQFVSIAPLFKAGVINFIYPVSYSSFFIFGALYFTTLSHRTPRWYLPGAAILGILSVLVLASVSPQPTDLSEHVFPPDIYYIASCYTILFLLLAFRHTLGAVVGRWKVLRGTTGFIQRHGMSIFLLYSFARHLVVLLLFQIGILPQEELFGLLQIPLAIMVLLIIIVPFTWLYRSLTSAVRFHNDGTDSSIRKLPTKST